MKSWFSLSILLLVLAFTTGCPTTELVLSQKVGDSEPKQFQKLGVVVIAPKMGNRSTVEMAVADALYAKGIKAIATFTIFPMVGQMDKIKENMDEETIKQKIHDRVAENQLDGLLIISLLDKTKETRYVPGSSFTLSAPVYGYSYYGYYAYASTTVYDPGYYTTDTNYFIEANLYDVGTEKLIWTAQTKSCNPESTEKEAPNFAKLITDELLAKKVLAP